MNAQDKAFVKLVWDYYAKHKRSLPWRDKNITNNFSLYPIVVSEIMLQQTQVNRVVKKYADFLKQFPTWDALAQAPLADVLVAWQGLGYNRRAKYLHDIAKNISQKNPTMDEAGLTALPGIGSNTACAILVYCKNEPHTFIETNIRSVLIHHYFKNQKNVTDRMIAKQLNKVIDVKQPREWYWALMDYGTFIKATHGNNTKQSKHYTKQSVFAGSNRQIRGGVLRLLATKGPQTKKQLKAQFDERIDTVLQTLQAEGLIVQKGRGFTLPK